MNAIAKLSPSARLIIQDTAPGLPHLSPLVANAVAAVLNPVIGKGMFGGDDPGHRVDPPKLRGDEWQEAQRAADAIDAMLQPVTYPLMLAWLTPINFACRNMQQPDEFSARVSAMTEMLCDLPGAAFTAEARRRMDSNGFFPSAHDIRQAVEPVAVEWIRTRNALRNLHRTKIEPPVDRVVESEEERAVNGEKNRLAIAAMKIQMEERERAARPNAATRPNHISPSQRIAFHRSKGQHAVADAIARANGIRKDPDA